jgi:tubulin-specific chaperone D
MCDSPIFIFINSIKTPELLRGISREAFPLPAPSAADPATSSADYYSLLTRAVLVSRLLNAVVTVRGYKTALRFFGHEAADLEPVVALLLRIEGEEALGRAARLVPQEVQEGNGGLWETKRVLMLWLAILVLIPFDLKTVDTSLARTNGGEAAAAGGTAGGGLAAGLGAETPEDLAADGGLGTPPVVRSLLRLCRGYLSSPGGSREMAAILLGERLSTNMRTLFSSALHATIS